MHALEDALAIVQAQSPQAGAHPLLKTPLSLDDDDDGEFDADLELETLQGTRRPSSRERTRSRGGGHRNRGIGDDNGTGGLADAFGGLHMDGDHGASRFFGPSGGSEVSAFVHLPLYLTQI